MKCADCVDPDWCRPWACHRDVNAQRAARGLQPLMTLAERDAYLTKMSDPTDKIEVTTKKGA